MSDERAACRRKALELLARRAHFARQLAEKLQRKGWEQDLVGEVVEGLEHEGLIDDRSLAASFVAGRLRRGSIGRTRVFWDLVQRGVARDLADATLDEHFPENETELAHRAAERWKRGGSRRGSSRDGEAALARFLERRGFAKGAIVAVLSARRRAAERASETD